MWLPRSALPRRCRKAASFAVLGVALNLVAGASCSTSEAGLAVDVQLESPEVKRPIETDRGYAVTLERGYLAVGSVELEGCETARFPTFELSLGPRVAFAHSMNSPTRIGSPQVLSLTEPEAPALPFGSLGPPPGDYCSLRLGLEPADSDASHLPTDVDFTGTTLWLEGTYRDSSGKESAFSVASSSSFEESVPFERIELGDDADDEATLVVRMESAHWFDGIDFATANDEEIANQVLDNLRGMLEVTVR